MQLVPSLLIALTAGHTTQATHQTPNFVVNAASPEVAKLVAEKAEACRKQLATLWLEHELPNWSVPCEINVAVGLDRTEGRTDVSFSSGRVSQQKIEVRGPIERVLNGPLPHELTHVLFAHYFGVQPPRWADEGGAILSEDGVQGERQRKLFRKIMAEDRSFPLRRLLGMRQYPADLPCLYAQGHSISRFLVIAGNRKTFLAFVRDGLDRGWDEAARERYGYESVEGLEQAWLGWVATQPESSAQ